MAAAGGLCAAVLVGVVFTRGDRPQTSFWTSCTALLVLLALPALPEGVLLVFLPISLIHLLALHAVIAATGRWRLPLGVSVVGLCLILLRAALEMPDPLAWGAFWAFVPLAGMLLVGSCALGMRDWQSRWHQERRLEEAVARERSLMAHEVHDVVAHSLAVVVAQADAALLVVDRDPQRARELVGNAVRAGREAMAEMRGVVGTVRDGAAPDTAPVRSLNDLDRLVGSFRSADTDVALTVEGDVDRVDAETARAAYRIVQESLTNASKHAPRPLHCHVTVDAGDREVRVRVRDDGPGLRRDPRTTPTSCCSAICRCSPSGCSRGTPTGWSSSPRRVSSCSSWRPRVPLPWR